MILRFNTNRFLYGKKIKIFLEKKNLLIVIADNILNKIFTHWLKSNWRKFPIFPHLHL